MRSLLLYLSICLGLSVQTARTAAEPVVVELFTSQGCYSCPPADALLGELAKDPEVIALAFHVDYWDHLGWADTFGSARHTERQRGYLGHADRSHISGYNLRGPFTPELVVNGQESLVGSHAKVVTARIAAHKGRNAPVELALDGDQVIVRPAGQVGTIGPAGVFLISYRPSASVAVLRGENAGKTMEYHNIVTGMRKLGQWSGSGEARFGLGKRTAGQAVVLIQEQAQGPILGAMRLK